MQMALWRVSDRKMSLFTATARAILFRGFPDPAEGGMYPRRRFISREVMRTTVFNYIECDSIGGIATVPVADSARSN